MNDHDIEQLVSRLDRPSPTPALDARITEITRQVQPQRSGWHLRGALRSGSAIACAGLVGFVIGRQSVSLPPVRPSVAERDAPRRAAAGLERDEPEATGRAFVPANEAFVRLMTKPKTFESVFGNQPVATQARPSAIQ